MAQVGAASSLSDTEAGPRCAWSIYTCQRERERLGLRSADILDELNFTEGAAGGGSLSASPQHFQENTGLHKT